MIHSFELMPGITLRCIRDSRFKQGRLLVRLVRPMDKLGCGRATLLTSVLIQGTRERPNMRRLAERCNELYGLSVGPVSLRVGDYHVFGFGSSFLDDRFAFDGGEVFAESVQYLRDLIFDPYLEEGLFCRRYVEREKINLIAEIDSIKNDKTAFAQGRLTKIMGRLDPMGIARLGEREDVANITPEELYADYLQALKCANVELFYVGSLEPEQVRDLTAGMFVGMERNPITLAPQTGLRAGEFREVTETMDVTQTRLCMGLYSDITSRDDRFCALRLCNAIFGAGPISKLFMTIREKMSLCYDIGSSLHGAKGAVCVTAGIEAEQVELVREQILEQLEKCRTGEISERELNAAKASVITSLRMVGDSAGSLEGYYCNQGLLGIELTPEKETRALQGVTVENVAAAARSLKLNTVYVMKGAR